MNGTGYIASDESLRLFLLITKHRMLDHYVPKLSTCLMAVDHNSLWLRETDHANTIGGITLHIIEHVSRSIRRLSEPNAPGQGGFEDFFPQKDANPAALSLLLNDTFREWGTVMDRLLESVCEEQLTSPPDLHHLYHLVEHCSYHLGQIVDRVQRITGASFRFVQNGVNEKSLRERIDAAIQAKF